MVLSNMYGGCEEKITYFNYVISFFYFIYRLHLHILYIKFIYLIFIYVQTIYITY